MSSLDKVIRFAEGSSVQLSAGGENPAATITDDDVSELVLSAELGLKQLKVLLASDDDNDTEPDDDEDDDQDSGGKGGGGSHAGHPTYKKLVAKGMNPKMAAAMCSKADNKVAASTLVDSLEVILSGLSGRGLIALAAPPGESAEERRQSAREGNALPDGSYPIPDKKHLHSAAVLAASGHGNVSGAKRLIRKRARELGVDVNSLPGFGSSSDKGEKVAASAVSELVTLTGLPEDHAFEFLALARKAAVPLQAFHHGTHNGMHSHGHLTMSVHEHDHAHNGDSMHDRHSHGGMGGDDGDNWGSRGGEY